MTCPLCDSRMTNSKRISSGNTDIEDLNNVKGAGMLACAGCGFQLYFKGMKGFSKLSF